MEGNHADMVFDVENKYIPFVSAITTASPAISDAYKFIFPEKSISTINNVFPLDYAINLIKELPQKPLKLFWFSQHIGRKRGLENIIQAMGSFDQDDIQLTLLGSCSHALKIFFSSLAESSGLSKKQLIFLNPVSENQLVYIASEHHIGLASEPGRDLNNELALSNKIMIYLLAGCAIISSNTKAQVDFMEKYPGIGMLYEKESITDLQRVLGTYFEKPELLHHHRRASLRLAKTELNWDIESVKWLNIINTLTVSH
jgi:glycosyltransferase involved in cell wall biosynthesis